MSVYWCQNDHSRRKMLLIQSGISTDVYRCPSCLTLGYFAKEAV